ncbi:MAG TPA: methionine--tRNA ligase [Iamia sp.]|nr:methionine--tRNA ligase [Iamia sp.]
MARHLITSALPYINGVKHLGNLVGSMLPADVYARFLRQQGHEVVAICATDEHGTPAELAAEEAGVPVAEYCAQQWAIQKDLGERFGLAWDHFGRSSSHHNHELTQLLAHQLDEQGFIEERETEQIYSPTDGRFLPDRYVIGTCPHCGYPRARGDQCENCTRLLDPTDLIEPRSAISGATDLEVRATKHLYLLQSKMADRLRRWIDQRDDWPLLTRSIAYKWLDEGLEDRSITRDIDWGVPVDRPGFEGKVFYVWFDAPIAYIAATKEWALDVAGLGDEGWKRWWTTETASDVTYTQFMAKDNVPFHAVMFPATLLGAEGGWKLVDYIKSFNWLTFYGGKFSTSQHRGVFMDAALDILPSDQWRYHLIANAPETSDASFTWESLVQSVNKDLAGSYGNLVNRVLGFTAKNAGGVVPTVASSSPARDGFVELIGDLVASYTEHLENKDLRKATTVLRELWSAGNVFWNAQEPWKLTDDPAGRDIVISTALHHLRLLAVISAPILPDTSAALLRAFGIADLPAWPTDVVAELAALTPGSPIEVPPVLFAKIDDDEIVEWTTRFGAADE